MKTEDRTVEILHKLIELKPMKHDFEMEDEPKLSKYCFLRIDASMQS
jgi:hypothetical protein